MSDCFNFNTTYTYNKIVFINIHTIYIIVYSRVVKLKIIMSIDSSAMQSSITWRFMYQIPFVCVNL